MNEYLAFQQDLAEFQIEPHHTLLLKWKWDTATRIESDRMLIESLASAGEHVLRRVGEVSQGLYEAGSLRDIGHTVPNAAKEYQAIRKAARTSIRGMMRRRGIQTDINIVEFAERFGEYVHTVGLVKEWTSPKLTD